MKMVWNETLSIPVWWEVPKGGGVSIFWADYKFAIIEQYAI